MPPRRAGPCPERPRAEASLLAVPPLPHLSLPLSRCPFALPVLPRLRLAACVALDLQPRRAGVLPLFLLALLVGQELFDLQHDEVALLRVADGQPPRPPLGDQGLLERHGLLGRSLAGL